MTIATSVLNTALSAVLRRTSQIPSTMESRTLIENQELAISDKACTESCKDDGCSHVVQVPSTDDVDTPSILNHLRTAPLQIQGAIYEQPIYSEYGLQSPLLPRRVLDYANVFEAI